MIKVLKKAYNKLFLINDTPQRIALGAGIGVFAGILPGTGPIAALFLAFIFRTNRAAALIGSLLTNTWLSWVTLAISIQLGSTIMGKNWHMVQADLNTFIRNFHFSDLLKISILNLVIPAIIGLFLVALCAGLLVYISVLITLKLRAGARK